MRSRESRGSAHCANWGSLIPEYLRVIFRIGGVFTFRRVPFRILMRAPGLFWRKCDELDA